MKKILSQVLVAVVCAILGFLLTYQFKMLNIESENNTVVEEQDILSEIERLEKEKQELIATNESLSTELKIIEEAAAKEGEVESGIKTQLDNSRMHLGLVDVRGTGITITLTPKSAIFGANKGDTNISLTEEEIVHIVNTLWYSRAEAISVNDIRITPQTGIKTSGKNISIGSVGIVDPNEKITIKVIGDTTTLNVGVSYGGTLEFGALKNYTVEIKTKEEVIIGKTTQSLKNEYIKQVE